MLTTLLLICPHRLMCALLGFVSRDTAKLPFVLLVPFVQFDRSRPKCRPLSSMVDSNPFYPIRWHLYPLSDLFGHNPLDQDNSKCADLLPFVEHVRFVLLYVTLSTMSRHDSHSP